MLNLVFISFAFSAGIAAFFSPCSIALLPGFITYYASKKGEITSFLKAIRYGFWIGIFAILGFFTVFGIAGSLVIYLGQKVKTFIPLLSVITGFLLIVFGVLILFGKELLIKLPVFSLKKDSGAYGFGVAYAVSALGCTFPLFATVLFQGINDKSIISGLASLLAYIAGMSILMLVTTIVSLLARELIQKKINKILPIIHKISAVIIILAGLYMVYYQSIY